MTSDTETTDTALALEAPERKATNKAIIGAPRARVAPKQAKAGKKASAPKRAPRGAKSAKLEKGVRDGNKTTKVLDLLKRSGGATTQELMRATGWQPHSVRGFLSGTVAKKMGLAVTSTKTDDGERSYSIKGRPFAVRSTSRRLCSSRRRFSVLGSGAFMPLLPVSLAITSRMRRAEIGEARPKSR